MRRTRKTRGKAPRFVPSLDVDAWLQDNSQSLVACPHQPGNLRLMPASCIKRHNAANDPRWSNIGAEPFHVFVFKMNLVACRECKVGARLARQHKEAVA